MLLNCFNLSIYLTFYHHFNYTQLHITPFAPLTEIDCKMSRYSRLRVFMASAQKLKINLVPNSLSTILSPYLGTLPESFTALHMFLCFITHIAAVPILMHSTTGHVSSHSDSLALAEWWVGHYKYLCMLLCSDF